MAATTLRLWKGNLRSAEAIARSPISRLSSESRVATDRSSAAEKVDDDLGPLPGRGKGEVVGTRVGARERRDVHELLARPLVAVLDGQHVRVAVAEGVVHLGHDEAEALVAVVAVEEAHGVEDVAEDAAAREQLDAASRQLQAFPAHDVLEVLSDAGGRAGQVVLVAEAQGPRRLAAEEPQPPLECVDLVEVEERQEGAVAERVSRGEDPPVGHGAFVQGRVGAHAASPCAPGCSPLRRQPKASATFSADITPSSWKPWRRCAPA